MRTSVRVGIVGSSIAVVGSAALAAVAPSAGAVPSAGSYKSTATSTSGQVTVGGTPQSLLSATATPGNSPKTGSVGSAQLLSALNGVPTVGPDLVAAFKSGNPGGTDLVTVSSNASSGGTSAGCAAVLAADCTSGGSHPFVIKLGLGDLAAGLGSTPLGGVLASLPDPTKDSIVLTINGPRATCTAGPGGSGLTASESPADIVASVEDANGQQVAPPIPIHGGDILSQLSGLGLPSSVAQQVPLTVTTSPGSKTVSGGKAVATAGELGLGASGTSLFDVKGATASCGPNTQTTGTGGGTGPGTGPGSTGPGSTVPGSTGTAPSTSGEKPLTGIKTDEGRSSITSEPWLALNGMP